MRARVTSVVGLGEDVCQVAAAVRVEVLQGLAREVTLALPRGARVNQVNGATVGDWEAGGGMLRVRLLEPVRHRDLVRRAGRDARAARRPDRRAARAHAVRRARDRAASPSTSSGAGEIAGRQARGLEPADPSELGDIVAGRESPSMIAFRLQPLAGSEPRVARP